MSMTFKVDPNYPAATLAACEFQLRLLGQLFGAASTDLDLTEQSLCALMEQLRAMADAIAEVERTLRGPCRAKAA